MDAILDILRIVGLLGLLAFGLLGVFFPERYAILVNIKPLNERGKTEIRVNLGGFFIGLGLIPLIMNEPAAFQVAGGAYLAAAAARLSGYLQDFPKIDTSFAVALMLELVFGIVLVM